MRVALERAAQMLHWRLPLEPWAPSLQSPPQLAMVCAVERMAEMPSGDEGCRCLSVWALFLTACQQLMALWQAFCSTLKSSSACAENSIGWTGQLQRQQSRFLLAHRIKHDLRCLDAWTKQGQETEVTAPGMGTKSCHQQPPKQDPVPPKAPLESPGLTQQESRHEPVCARLCCCLWMSIECGLVTVCCSGLLWWWCSPLQRSGCTSTCASACSSGASHNAPFYSLS